MNAQPAPDAPADRHERGTGFSVSRSTIRQLLDDDAARAILERHFAEMMDHPQLQMAADMTLEAVAAYAPQILTPEKLQAVNAELARLAEPPAPLKEDV